MLLSVKMRHCGCDEEDNIEALGTLRARAGRRMPLISSLAAISTSS